MKVSRKLLSVPILALILLIAYSRQSRQTPLSIDASQLTIGPVWPASDLQHELTIFNTSRERVHVDRMNATCGCVSIFPRSFDVPANGYQKLKLVLDVRPNQRESSLLLRQLNVELRAYAGAAALPECIWQLNCRVLKAPVRPSVTQVTFNNPGDIIVGDRAASQSVLVDCEPDVEDLSLSVSSADVSAVAQKNDATNTFSICITPSFNLPRGKFSSTVAIMPIIRRPLPTMNTFSATIAVQGFRGHEVEVAPQEIRYGHLRLGKPIQQRVTIYSLYDVTDFIIPSWRCVTLTDIDSFHIDEPLPLLPKRSHDLTLTFVPTVDGPQSGTLEFFVSISSQKTLTIPLQYSYYGLKHN